MEPFWRKVKHFCFHSYTENEITQNFLYYLYYKHSICMHILCTRIQNRKKSFIILSSCGVMDLGPYTHLSSLFKYVYTKTTPF